MPTPLAYPGPTSITPGVTTDHDLHSRDTHGILANLLTTVAGTTHTLVLANFGEVLKCTSASAVVVTVPANASVAFPLGTSVGVLQHGTGAVSVAAGGGVTVRTPLTLALRAQYSLATLLKIGTDEWLVQGDLV